MTDMATARPKHVGAAVQRLEDPRLLTGAGRYSGDIKLDRMVHAAFLRSDQAHARIGAIDIAEAVALPGVHGVFTAADFADVLPISAPSTTPGYRETKAHALTAKKVRHVGEPVAVVVAADRYIAEDALALIDVDYEPLEAEVDPRDAAKDGAPLLHEDAGTNILIERVFEMGDLEAAKAAATQSVRGSFRMRRKSALAMENRSYVADFDRGRGNLTLYGSTQAPGIIRDALARVLSMPGHRIRVIAPDVGGGFGGKVSLYPEEVVVTALARKLERPVKWVGDRLEDLASTYQSFDEHLEAELGFDDDGALVYLEGDIVGDVGAHSVYPWTAAIEPTQVAGFLPGPYRIPAYRGRLRAVATPKPPMGPYRGVGRPAAVFVTERLIDMAARKLGIDPRDMRSKNLVQAEEFPHRIGSGIIWDRTGFQECLDKACADISYGDLRAEQQAAREEGRCLGIGLATYAELTGIGSRIPAAPGMPVNTGSETAAIRVDATGAVSATFALASQGQGHETTLAQIVADEIGLNPEDIEIVSGDTGTVVHGTGTYASRSAVIGGGAAIKTAQVLRGKITAAAAHLLEAAPEDIDIEDGQIFVANTNRKIGFGDLAHAVYSDMRALPVEARIPLEASETFDPVVGTTTTATHIAVVEVDIETCTVRIDRYVVSEDCGRVINPLIVDGQVHGGVAQGVGVALLEEVQYDETGQLLTANLADYLVPTSMEVPSIEVSHVETELPSNPGGFRGMGEGGTIGAPAAIANAITDALAHLEIEVNDLPATPERLFRLVSTAKTKAAED